MSSLVPQTDIHQLIPTCSISTKSHGCPHLALENVYVHVNRLQSTRSSKHITEPWLVWLSGLSTCLKTKGCRFDSQSGYVPELLARSMLLLHIDISLPLFLPPFPSL